MVTTTPRRRPSADGGVRLHRSIWRLRLPWHRLVAGVAIAAEFTLLLLIARTWIGLAWSHALVWWLRQLGLSGRFEVPGTGASGLPVPIVDMRLAYGGQVGILAHAVACTVVWVLAGRLSDAAKPACYLLRFAVLVHASSLAYFAFWPASFPHSLSSHLTEGLRSSWALMLLTPWIHLFTYHLFPFALWKRLAVTAISLAWLFVLAPLQYACHAALLSVLGLMTMPVLYLLFGVMLPILGLVAIYGWAMSWAEPVPGQRRVLAKETAS